MTESQIVAVPNQFAFFSDYTSPVFPKVSLPKAITGLLLLAACFSFSELQAQDYSRAIGIRAGSTRGISYKAFFSDYTAFEGLIVHHKDGFRGIAMAEYHIPLGRRSNTSFYLGAGAYAGVNALLDEFPGQTRVAGVNAIVGFEYTFPSSPVVFALDLNPSYELVQNFGFSGNQAALSLRYILR